jgi:CheY-like chemotaxis protein
MPRHRSLCGYAFKSSGTFIVEDAAGDDRFNRTPMVTEAGFRFYIGVPLLAPDGHSLGTLCVLDRTPRTPTHEQVTRLQALAAQVLQQLEIRRAARAVPAIPLRRIVLIVDDEAPIRDLVTTAFARYEVPTITATNGAEALRIYQERRDEIAVVLTDLHMPEMNGLQLIRALRRDPNPPVITVMSGWLDPQVRNVLAAENTACLIDKPFRFSDFAPIVTLARQATGAPLRTA